MSYTVRLLGLDTNAKYVQVTENGIDVEKTYTGTGEPPPDQRLDQDVFLELEAGSKWNQGEGAPKMRVVVESDPAGRNNNEYTAIFPRKILADLLSHPATEDALVIRLGQANPDTDFMRLSKAHSDTAWLCESGAAPVPLSRKQFQALIRLGDYKVCRKARALLDERLQQPENARSIDANLTAVAEALGTTYEYLLSAGIPQSINI